MIYAAFMGVCLLSSPVMAEDISSGHGGLVPVTSSDSGGHIEGAPILRLTPDKSELVRLDGDAVSVVVGNPQHASVLVESPRLLVVVPKAPGATHFTVLNKDGGVIMQQNVIVSGPAKDYVRVRRGSCGEKSKAGECAKTDVYYCPDMCHGISPGATDGKAPNNAGSGDDQQDDTGPDNSNNEPSEEDGEE